VGLGWGWVFKDGFIALIAGLIISLNVDNQDAQSGVSVITPSNTNTSVDNHTPVTPATNTPANTKLCFNVFNLLLLDGSLFV
jgi:hypothetical protein